MSTPTKRNHSEAIAGFAKMFARPVPTSASSTRALPPTKLPTSSTRGTRASFEEFAEHNVSATSSTRGEEVGEERRSAGISAAELTQEQLTQERLTQERLEMASAAQEGLNPLIKAAVCVPSPPPSPQTSLTLTLWRACSASGSQQTPLRGRGCAGSGDCTFGDCGSSPHSCLLSAAIVPSQGDCGGVGMRSVGATCGSSLSIGRLLEWRPELSAPCAAPRACATLSRGHG